MERLTLLIGLLVITLIVNVALGIELYYALHGSSQPIAQTPLNISGLQIITSNTSTTTITRSTTTALSSSTTSTSLSLHSFSFKVKFKLHINKKGIYIIGIKPKAAFGSLYVLIYFNNGNAVILTLNHTTANITFYHKEVEAIMYVEGSTYQNLTPTQILQDLGLYLKFVSPINQNDSD